MSECPAVENQVKAGTGRTAAECEERSHTSKAAALSMIADEAKARAMKTARLRELRLKHVVDGRAPMHEASFSLDHQDEELDVDPEAETGDWQELCRCVGYLGQ